MMTVKQVSSLTGVSVRSLQFYDGIGLFKPTQVTEAGYRLYDEGALETLQQILFFKELDFTLREIKIIMSGPQFDKAAVYQKQRELLAAKRDRLDRLLELLDRLVKGENCMEFKEFDMGGYYKMLEGFKSTHTAEIIERFGSVEQFDETLSKVKAHGERAAGMAVKLYGSLDAYTDAMKKNFTHYLAHGPGFTQEEALILIEETEALTHRVTEQREKAPASPEVQTALRALIAHTEAHNGGMDLGPDYWPYMAENYLTSPTYLEVTDKKYGEGASKFLGRALQAYLDGQ